MERSKAKMLTAQVCGELPLCVEAYTANFMEMENINWFMDSVNELEAEVLIPADANADKMFVDVLKLCSYDGQLSRKDKRILKRAGAVGALQEKVALAEGETGSIAYGIICGGQLMEDNPQAGLQEQIYWLKAHEPHGRTRSSDEHYANRFRVAQVFIRDELID